MSKDRADQLVDAGIWLKLSGDKEGARKLFERALRIDPGNEKATQLLTPQGEVNERKLFGPQEAGSAHPFERPSHEASLTEEWGMAIGPQLQIISPPAPPPPASDLDEDWGVLTAPSTSPAAQKPPQAGARTIHIGGSAGPEPSPPSTPPLFGLSPAPPSQVSPTADRSASAPESQLSPPPSSAGMVDVKISGGPRPESPPASTPPLFGVSSAPASQPSSTERQSPLPAMSQVPPPSSSAGMVDVKISGGPRPESPPASTPPLFSFTPPTGPPLPAKSPATGAENAWNWSSSSSVPRDEALPTPIPSPSLVPRAESAWEHRSNPGIKLEEVLGVDRALDLISPPAKSSSSALQTEDVKTILRAARNLLELDDHSGAMEMIGKAQALAPDDPDVLSLWERSENTLLTMLESKLGKLETVPRVLLKEDEIIWLNLDHRAGFVLAQIDGTVSFDDLFSVSGMSRFDTARILAQLVEEGVISRG